MEKWIDVKGYEKIYEVSNLGRIRTHKDKTTINNSNILRKWKQRVLKQKYNKIGKDFRVSLWKNGENKDLLVSRIVAFNFLSQDINDRSLTVNHKDGNRKNNKIENLEIVTLQENIKHAQENGLYDKTKKKVKCDDKIFNSMNEFDLFIGRKKGYTSYCLKRSKEIKSKDGKIFQVEVIK